MEHWYLPTSFAWNTININLLTLNVWISFVAEIVIDDSEVYCKIIWYVDSSLDAIL